ncbi:MAG TPA: SctK family type III secretion system sorting platform protein [Ramlibacter sp.]|uniref:SctK family type III secretion system sorting platform protein n=1 Tax=Ramlibacter sp. TaxID=1917967 RepID=UPI002D274D0B|nr:SctK family type III secretion system sorting platform protein [Ramlibacter sp.]HZY20512.1 SctK family type III secretion system sorting platform protein [Ramlibacter sp.]
MAAAFSLGHPLAESLLRFELLPSLLLHPAQAARLLPDPLRRLLAQDPAAVPGPVLHRHWSAALRRELRLGPVMGLGEEALAIALLPQPAFDRLVLHCGIALLAPAVRRTIAREDVAALRDQLGEAGWQFALRGAPQAPAVGQALDHRDAAAQAQRLGAAVLDAAFDAAAAPVADRARLRLAPGAAAGRALLPIPLAAGTGALALALSVLASLDPAWLSSFRATR